MVKIVRSEKLSKYLVENRVRLTEKGCGVVLIEPKAGSLNPADEISSVLAMLLEANDDLINTATGITPVPGASGAQFKGIATFISRKQLLGTTEAEE